MSYQYHGTTNLITLPGREVQTFPSGLVRITRTYVCRKGLEGQFRQLLAEGSVLPNDDAAPCIDGAYIFPTPIENIREDGFVEFRVTAYGRTNTTGAIRESIKQTFISGDTFTYPDLTVESVLPSATALQQLSIPPNYDLAILAQSTSADQLLRTIDIPIGASITRNQFLGGAIQLIGPSFIATDGGVIFERQGESYNETVYQRAYLFNGDTAQIQSSDQRYFGFFSEFSIAYGIPESPATSLGDVRSFKINGVRV